MPTAILLFHEFLGKHISADYHSVKSKIPYANIQTLEQRSTLATYLGQLLGARKCATKFFWQDIRVKMFVQ